MVHMTGRKCIHCKGAHDEQACPLYRKALALYKVKNLIKSESFEGSSPAPFIGRVGYPNVNVGILAPPIVSEEIARYDAPRQWSKDNTQISDIVGFRSELVNSRTNLNIKNTNRFMDIVKEVAMAEKPVDLEINLNKIPRVRMVLDGTMAPTGPSADLKNARITSNTKIPTKVENAVSDTDWKASEALSSLYERGIEENQLSKLLSVGALGIGANRKLVPTRWSITATDDTIGKNIIKEIKDLPSLGEFKAYTGMFFGNYYLIMLFPKVWSYELFETYVPTWHQTQTATTDYESFFGRKDYAENTAGGYYTVRLAILEKLKQIKRQASVLALRFVTEEYSVPLGVWVTREASRKSINSSPIEFGSEELMLQYAKAYARRKFNMDITALLTNSKLLTSLKQKQLENFA